MYRVMARWGLVVLLLTLAVGPLAPLHAQTDPIDELMAQMSVGQKVGQLFLVTFWGRDLSPLSRVGTLVREHKVGGVVLLSSNGNIINGGVDTPANVLGMTNKLQSLALGRDGPAIPLFIAIDHEGDGFPYTRITSGLTPLPNPMAIGATWNVDYAGQIGEIVGRELAALGINMLLGPVVDVLNDPRPGGRGDVGTRVFGGDPYWVGEMGRAYVRGVHQGSNGRVLTVAKHFPGHGGSDRLPDDEVATVDKSLQELRRVELPPFFAITNPSGPDDPSITDALMSSHIRYRGFQGDIRQFTRPISFDVENMQALLRLPELQTWRQDGVIVSDSLGVPAVRKYFDPQLRTFPHRQVAREAFLAGNDILLLSQFALTADLTRQYENMIDTIAYFRETYLQDAAFAARVDDAVRRILRLKLNLYPDWTPEVVGVSLDGLAVVGQGGAVADEIARRAVTLLHPTLDSLPLPPQRSDDLLIFVDDRLVRECYESLPACEPHPLLPAEQIREAILRLYGPTGTDQIDIEHIHTLAYADLKSFMELPKNEQLVAEGETSPPSEESVEGGAVAVDDPARLLQEAEWIIFAMLEPNPNYASSDALQLFLAQNAQRIYNARVIVWAFTAPYYLDATEISKLTACYVFYGKTAPFIEAAARTLFGELRPQGRSPVSIEGTYYDLVTQLSPKPDQQISLNLLQPTRFSAEVPATLQVRTNLIVDRNGNPVPDGTQVQFMARDADSGQLVLTEIHTTAGGVAEAQFTIALPMRLALTVRSGDTAEGPPLLFDALSPPTPTPLPPTRTPVPTWTPSWPTDTPVPTVTTTPSLSPMPTGTPILPPLDARPARRGGWAGRLTDLWGVCLVWGLVWGLGQRWRGRRWSLSRRVRLALLSWIGAWGGYLVYGWGWATVSARIDLPAWLVGGAVALIGAVALSVAALAQPHV